MGPTGTPSSLERKLMFTHEHKHVLALFRSLRFWAWCGVVLVPALGTIAYRAWTAFEWTPILLGLFLALGIAVLAVQSVARGRVITNTGIFIRRSEPIRFWISMIGLGAMYALLIVAILRM